MTSAAGSTDPLVPQNVNGGSSRQCLVGIEGIHCRSCYRDCIGTAVRIHSFIPYLAQLVTARCNCFWRVAKWSHLLLCRLGQPLAPLGDPLHEILDLEGHDPWRL